MNRERTKLRKIFAQQRKENTFLLCWTVSNILQGQLTGAVEYADCISVEG